MIVSLVKVFRTRHCKPCGTSWRSVRVEPCWMCGADGTAGTLSVAGGPGNHYSGPASQRFTLNGAYSDDGREIA